MCRGEKLGASRLSIVVLRDNNHSPFTIQKLTTDRKILLLRRALDHRIILDVMIDRVPCMGGRHLRFRFCRYDIVRPCPQAGENQCEFGSLRVRIVKICRGCLFSVRRLATSQCGAAGPAISNSSLAPALGPHPISIYIYLSFLFYSATSTMCRKMRCCHCQSRWNHTNFDCLGGVDGVVV